MASFAANTLLNGADAPAWRLVNVALHAANATLVALLSWQLAGRETRGARAGGDRRGPRLRMVRAKRRSVAWIAARFDGMALLFMLLAACSFMVSRTWWDRYGLASLAASALAFMCKESAAIGPVLIAALAWARRPIDEGFMRRSIRALLDVWPWIALGAAYFAYRKLIFGDPFRFYPGTVAGIRSPGRQMARRTAGERRLVAQGDAGAVAASRLRALRALSRHRCRIRGLTDRREGCVLVALVYAFIGACALLFSHWGWSGNGEGGRVLYALAAIASLAIALPLRSPDGGLRRVGLVIALVFLGSGLRADTRHRGASRTGRRRHERTHGGARCDGRRDLRRPRTRS
jgi:hypothetical protein